MNRRELLQRVAQLMGGAISTPAILGVLSGCSAKPGLGWTPTVLTPDQVDVVSAVAEHIIPRTDTPGAIDVGVPEFIDVMLKNTYSAADRERYLAGLAELEAQAQQLKQKKFVNLEPANQLSLVQRAHDEALAQERASSVPVAPRPFILMTKELTMLGFFTSEAGATQLLQYQAVPGESHGCVPLAEAGAGRTWALETSMRF